MRAAMEAVPARSLECWGEWSRELSDEESDDNQTQRCAGSHGGSRKTVDKKTLDLFNVPEKELIPQDAEVRALLKRQSESISGCPGGGYCHDCHLWVDCPRCDERESQSTHLDTFNQLNLVEKRKVLCTMQRIVAQQSCSSRDDQQKGQGQGKGAEQKGKGSEQKGKGLGKGTGSEQKGKGKGSEQNGKGSEQKGKGPGKGTGSEQKGNGSEQNGKGKCKGSEQTDNGEGDDNDTCTLEDFSKMMLERRKRMRLQQSLAPPPVRPDPDRDRDRVWVNGAYPSDSEESYSLPTPIVTTPSALEEEPPMTNPPVTNPPNHDEWDRWMFGPLQ